ncbi:DUF3558 domain-containing protein [Amycolatopsis sp. NPDC004169]|uniref:DUF3558 domain-containing protein n=1 Tax=Amycolatopsis sp. NPDC004169 TaxID=3154453 RepID=UPI00339DDCB1
MNKSLTRIVLPLLIGGALLAGCTTTKGGTASPAQSSSAGESKPPDSTSSGGGGTQSITDPCSLLEMSDLSSYGQFDPPENGKIGSARSCSYQKQIASASDKSMVVGANVRDNASIDQVRDTGRGVSDTEINGRKAKESPDGVAPGCTLALAVGDSSRVDVEVTAVASSDEACQVAEAVAKTAVEPRLPKG